MTPPILGIFASAVTGGVSTTSFESIATVIVGSGGSSSITFSSIPSTYAHLQIRANFSTNVGEETLTMNYNSDSGSNYSWHQLYGTGSVFSSGGSNSNTVYVGYVNRSGQPGSFVLDILDYANTSKYKTSRELFGADNNTVGGSIGMRSHNWRNTNAITSIVLASGGTINQYSHFALYGIKSA
jgi:hypothetical protein